MFSGGLESAGLMVELNDLNVFSRLNNFMVHWNTKMKDKECNPNLFVCRL